MKIALFIRKRSIQQEKTTDSWNHKPMMSLIRHQKNKKPRCA